MSEFAQADDHVVLGKLTSPYGVKGWLKVYSYTSPMDGILDYAEWVLRHEGRLQRCRLLQGRRHGKGLVAQLDGVDGRETAEALAGAEILLPKAELPKLEGDEVYWYQLEGLKVVTTEGLALGRIDHLFETGANDVIVVKGSLDEAADDRERLLPYLPGDVITDIDLDAGVMTVDWDPEF
ncbi:ribosome maturation factor RimM [Halomonas urumqiensis]|uniref:Ribosome maturation factor RimM n=1 Tax=Halomonas urumqiensis TaxID=1684789 RepID=A0A2N7UJ00_9GAMM|nr:ribosome maturation factor RimM [Halomonas urumqiensis]PMR80375.1 ribosome maturation factor RimM [Halomonas urumqiensis]PTB01520.1 ribosome maturation factor RimM [Halomonas urumqiensis]GHE22399.1 ribosome maturation factor RimM [Halomonas urumqiensis]